MEYRSESRKQRCQCAARIPVSVPWPVGWCFRILLIFAVGLLPIVVPAQNSAPTETQVEAAYLFNFARFVRWPGADRSSTPLQVCVLGKNPFGSVLDSTVRGESVGSRPVLTRSVANLQQASGCQILFISESEASHLDAILLALRHQGCLTVSNIPRFADRGGMIEFLRQDDRIRFKVNVAPMVEGGVSVSSELLKVATKVIGQSGGAK
jgi:hypothetical protein